MQAASIPTFVTHLAADGRVLATAATLADAATPEAATALRHLTDFAGFVHGRAPEALDQVRQGLRIVVDDSLVDDALVGGDGAVRLGRAGVRFLADPIEHPVTIGHELTHALRLPDGNYMSEELGADLVGLAYARSIGRAPSSGPDAWRNTMVGRDLRTPKFATMDELRASPSIDTHHMADPVGRAVAFASDEVGVPVMDEITTDAVLRRMPRTSEQLRATLDDLIWSNAPHDTIQARVADASMANLADALLAAAADHPTHAGAAVTALRRELVAVGLHPGAR